MSFRRFRWLYFAGLCSGDEPDGKIVDGAKEREVGSILG